MTEQVKIRSGRWWAARVPALPGVHTQARRLDQVAEMAREAIALMLDVDAYSFEVTVNPVLSEHTRQALDRSTEGLTLRDAGRILGLTHQRVDQLLAS